jgi:catechol 2,3-dioxygenase-like lactoylglutathione lyase family enzyme
VTGDRGVGTPDPPFWRYRSAEDSSAGEITTSVRWNFAVRSPAYDIGNHSNVSTVNKEAAVPEFPPIAHVAVTVTDLDRSTRWYSELLATKPVLDEDEQTGGFHHTVFAVGGGQLFGLHTHPQAAGDSFDEHRTGLDHVAFACRDRGELLTWAARLDELGIAHGGIVDAHYGSGVSFRDPDGIALEFFAPPG